MPHYDCCYANCDRPGTIYIGENGNPDTQWICRCGCLRFHIFQPDSVPAPDACDGGGTLLRRITTRTMPVEDICDLRIPCADDSILFLWVPAPLLREAIQVMTARGL
jgi:hypothetical protein